MAERFIGQEGKLDPARIVLKGFRGFFKGHFVENIEYKAEKI